MSNISERFERIYDKQIATIKIRESTTFILHMIKCNIKSRADVVTHGTMESHISTAVFIMKSVLL